MMTRRSVIGSAVAGAGAALAPFGAMASPTAKQAGFWYPEETERHTRTFMQWPVSRIVYDDADFLSDLQGTIADIANTIAAFEPVVMLMAAKYAARARKLLGAEVEIWDIPTDDLWCRDSGPSFVVDGKGGLAVTQFNFNGWGGKQVHGNDGLIAQRIAERLGLPVFDAGLVGEAGGVETDGHGTLIAHESSWINPNRNTGNKAEVDAMLLQVLGAQKVLWAPGIAGADITDYHIDALARFVRQGQVVVQIGDVVDPDDPWSVAAFETHAILAKATDAQGAALELVLLPEPLDIRVDADDFVASYVNYYICTGAVIAAEFGDAAADTKARDVLSSLYPDREVVMLNIDPVGEVGGGIHCATHEQPAV